MSKDSPCPPEEFYCSLSTEIMQDPVTICATGETYERKFIEQHLTTNLTCPNSDKVLLKPPTLIPNCLLKRLIRDWSRKHCTKSSSVQNKKKTEGTLKKGSGGDENEERWTSLMKAIYLAANDSDYYRILDTAKVMFESNIEPKKMSKDPPCPPEEFYCILSKEIMRDPVVINSTGETYERKFIEEHLKTSLTCPKSGKVLLKTPTLIPHLLVKGLIQDWSNKHCPKSHSVEKKV